MRFGWLHIPFRYNNIKSSLAQELPLWLIIFMKDKITLDYPSTLFDRHFWVKGKWSSEHDVYIWVDEETDYDCLIVRLRLGYLSGYVGINNQHPLYGKLASDELVAPLKIHGSKIFSSEQINKMKKIHAIIHHYCQQSHILFLRIIS